MTFFEALGNLNIFVIECKTEKIMTIILELTLSNVTLSSHY